METPKNICQISKKKKTYLVNKRKEEKRTKHLKNYDKDLAYNFFWKRRNTWKLITKALDLTY